MPARALRWGLDLLVTAVLCAAVVGAVEGGLRLAGRDGLGARAQRVWAYLAWRASPDERLVRTPSGCPRMRAQPGWRDEDGVVRDPLGRRVLGPEDALVTVLVTGDSVPAGGLADVLADAAREAGRVLRIVDASLPDYGFADQRCTIAEAADLHGLTAIVGSIVANDVPIPEIVRLDLGAGPHSYAWPSVVQRPIDELLAIPLLLDSDTRWVAAHAPTLRARWGEAVRLDVAGPELLSGFLRTLPPITLSDAPGHLLGAELASSGVAGVFLAYPLLHRPRPHAADPVIDRAIADVAQAGVPIVDLRDALVPLGHDRLGVPPTDPRLADHYDPLHLNRAGLALAAEAALARLALWPEVRAALHRRAAAALGPEVACRPFEVADVPVATPPPPCVDVGPR